MVAGGRKWPWLLLGNMDGPDGHYKAKGRGKTRDSSQGAMVGECWDVETFNVGNFGERWPD
jgi:hypothetical protein